MLVFPMLSDFHPFIKDFGIPTVTYLDPCTFHLSILWTVRPPLFLNVSQIIVMLLCLCVQRGILFVTTNRLVLRKVCTRISRLDSCSGLLHHISQSMNSLMAELFFAQGHRLWYLTRSCKFVCLAMLFL